ncbi:MAG: DUF4087 domain-containing protein [Pyrinomonadaceae bacterium]|nr:DUF4087 domain-containing protein [Pyrinomonadaceae bacterium]
MKNNLVLPVLVFIAAAVFSGCQTTSTSENSEFAAASPSATSAPDAVSKAGEAKTPESTPAVENKANEKDADPSETESKVENRCGWFFNPTPANAWLNDKDGQWIIAVQDGHQAEGDWAEFSDDQWVATNGNYGYGCACMRVIVDKKNMRVLKIVSARSKALSACRRDKALNEPID